MTRQKNAKLKIFSRILTALVFTGVILLSASCFFIKESRNDKTDCIGTEIFKWNEVYSDGTEKLITLPAVFDESGKMILRSTLPQIQDGQSLLIKVNFSKLIVKVDGKTIYRKDKSAFGMIRTMVGNYIAFVPLQAEDSGKNIEIEAYVRNARVASTLKNTAILYQADYLISQTKTYLFNLIMGILYCLLALVMFGVWGALSFRSLPLGNHSKVLFVYAGIFLMSLGIWLISDVHLLGIYTGRLTLSGLINYIAFNLLPVGCMGLAWSFYEVSKSKAVWNILFRVIQLNFIIQCVLFLTGIKDLPQMLPVTQFLCVISLFSFVIASSVGALKNSSTGKRISIFTTLVISIAFTVSIALYLMDKSILSWTSFASLLLGGWVVCTLLLVTYQMVCDGIRFEEMRTHAYTDDLTGMYNRRAYVEDVERIQASGDSSNLILGQIDVNGLKLTNDTYGHTAGDELLKAVSECILQSFGPLGKCYRMGGDEFSVVAFAEKEVYEKAERAFTKALADRKGENIHSPSAAIGKACQSEHAEASITQLEKIADDEMYKAKKKFYENSHMDRRKK